VVGVVVVDIDMFVTSCVVYVGGIGVVGVVIVPYVVVVGVGVGVGGRVVSVVGVGCCVVGVGVRSCDLGCVDCIDVLGGVVDVVAAGYDGVGVVLPLW